MTDIFDLFDKISKSTPAPGGPVTHIVAGLGNIGDNYAHTRHNTGFLCLDRIAADAGAKVTTAKFHALTGEATVAGHRVLLMKPTTLMNLSGVAIGEAAAFYKIPPENILVICDDVNFDVGMIRIRRDGSHGGHNGLRNIEEHLASRAYPRIRVGVGRKPTPEYDLAAWVLGTFPKADEDRLLNETAPAVSDAVSLIIGDKCDLAMSRYSK